MSPIPTVPWRYLYVIVTATKADIPNKKKRPGGRLDQNLKIAMEKYLTVETLQV
jgi:hypothetical protein